MSTEVNATTVRLPQFSPNQPLTWFRRAERHFNLKKITSSATKADYTLEVLPDSVFVHIAPWLDTQPAEIKYEDLKATLLRTFCPTSAVRARRIIELPQQLGSDTTPTNAWHEISTLQQLPDVDAATGTHKQLDLAKEIWLMCLHHRSAVHYMTRTIAVSRNSSLKQSIATQLTMQLQGCAQLHRTSQRSLAYAIRGHTICPVQLQLCQPQLPSRLADHPVHSGKLTNHIYVGIIAAMEMQHATVLMDANTSQKTLQPAVPRQHSRQASKHLRPTHQR